MNYKKRNVIGTLSFIVIFFIMLNFDFIFKTLNNKILGIKFIGMKDEELFLSDLNQENLTKIQIIEYINYNLKQMEIENVDKDKYDFSIYVKSVEDDDKFLEFLRIPIDDKFGDSLNRGMEFIPRNKMLLVKFVIYHDDMMYTSKIFNITLIEDSRSN